MFSRVIITPITEQEACSRKLSVGPGMYLSPWVYWQLTAFVAYVPVVKRKKWRAQKRFKVSQRNLLKKERLHHEVFFSLVNFFIPDVNFFPIRRGALLSEGVYLNQGPILLVASLHLLKLLKKEDQK